MEKLTLAVSVKSHHGLVQLGGWALSSQNVLVQLASPVVAGAPAPSPRSPTDVPSPQSARTRCRSKTSTCAIGLTLETCSRRTTFWMIDPAGMLPAISNESNA